MSAHMEIERRFLVDGRTQKPWRSEAKSIHNIEQYYLQASNLNLDQDGNLCLSDVIMTRPSKEEIVIFESEPDWIPRIRIKDGVSIFTVKGPRQGASGLELEWVVSCQLDSAQTDSPGTPFGTARYKTYASQNNFRTGLYIINLAKRLAAC